MSIEVLHSTDYRRMPWKIGGGETTEIFAWPPDSGFDNFDWRVSMANVTQDGPFSAFRGVERTLAILEGEGLHLDVEGLASVDLGASSPPFAFPADVPTRAQLVGGPVRDLNVMTRRGRFSHSVLRQDLSGRAAFASGADVTLMLCHRGSLEVDGVERLRAPDCLMVTDSRATIAVEAGGSASLFVVTIQRDRG